MSTQPQTIDPVNVPTTATLVKTTIAAIVVATILLITTILPAEYGVDPIGTGRMLGLTAISSPPVEQAAPTATRGGPHVPT